ncbi:hypothetical protein LTR93_011616 [Exophiala xenobiotica]|nr:hypothetical protein LTR93_011616 [Exophiala xenobiotica]
MASEGYLRDLLKTRTDDLEAHLDNINEKLEIIFEQTVTESSSEEATRQLIKEEQLSTQRCLQICARLSHHIDQLRLTPHTSGESPDVVDAKAFPEALTNIGLQECKNSLAMTVAKLEKHLRDLMDRLVAKTKTDLKSPEDVADLSRLQEEWEATRQSMEIFSKADHFLTQNTSTIDNYGLGNAVQFMVLTDGKTIRGTNRGLAWRTRQVGGHMSDETVQQFCLPFAQRRVQPVAYVANPASVSEASSSLLACW